MTLVLLGLGCDGGRGCAPSQVVESYRSWRQGSVAPAALPSQVVDCPDGLAQCVDGVVEASRLATIALACKGAEKTCTCPWDEVGSCSHGCTAEGLEIVVDRSLAAAQLCAPGTGSASLWSEAYRGGGTETAVSCDEPQLYRCVGGMVIDCHARRVAARCFRGCFAEGGFIDGDARAADAGDGTVRREAAFAILCSH